MYKKNIPLHIQNWIYPALNVKRFSKIGRGPDPSDEKYTYLEASVITG